MSKSLEYVIEPAEITEAKVKNRNLKAPPLGADGLRLQLHRIDLLALARFNSLF